MPSARKVPPRLSQEPPRRPLAATQLGDEDHAFRVLRDFRLIFNAVKSHFREVEKSAGLAGAQLWALSVVASHNGLGVGDLAQAMDVHQSTASNLVKALVAQDLVESRKDGIDRRATQLYVTTAGKRTLRKAPGPFTGVLPAALASLDAVTLTRLDKDLHKVIKALGVSRRGARIPLGQPDREIAQPRPRRRPQE